MPDEGWRKFLEGFPWYNEERKYPFLAYSEFMPPVRTGINPHDGSVYPWVFREDDPFGWQVPAEARIGEYWQADHSSYLSAWHRDPSGSPCRSSPAKPCQ